MTEDTAIKTDALLAKSRQFGVDDFKIAFEPKKSPGPIYEDRGFGFFGS